uniref:Uncharacterized protein n=1 Tax=Oryza barthii TaxID=65489 RepID=A0A0D3G4Z5_9ORYZ
MLALNAACEAPFREALRWVVRRGGGQATGWSEVACTVVDRQWYARHAPRHAQLLAPPLLGTGAINEIRVGRLLGGKGEFFLGTVRDAAMHRRRRR